MASINLNEEHEWRSRTRPQSTIAIQFSADLDSIFGLEKPSARDMALEEKRKSLDSRSTELAELQARLGAMETRLKHVQAREAPSAPVFMKESSSTTGKTVSVVEQPGARNLVVRSHRPRWAPRIVVTDSDEASEQDDGSYNKDSETKVSTGEGIGKPQAHRSHASRSQPVNSGQEQFHQA